MSRGFMVLVFALVPVTQAIRMLRMDPVICTNLQPNMTTATPDSAGYLWGYDASTGMSCKFVNALDGTPMYYTALISPTGALAVGYATGPVPLPPTGLSWLDNQRCLVTPQNSVTGNVKAQEDSTGHLWGYENGHSCIFRTPYGFPVFMSDVQSCVASWMYNAIPDHHGGYMTVSGVPVPQVADTWLCIPACPSAPTSNSSMDAKGRLWGTANTVSCAYRDANNNPVYAPPDTWLMIPACPYAPTSNGSMDSQGRLWGWANSASCAFRDANNKPIYPVATAPAPPPVDTWLVIPACPYLPTSNSSKDSKGRLWGWANNASCAFRDANGNPIYPAASPPSPPPPDSFALAPACPFAPTTSNSSKDSQGRLWGWANNASCAFKDASGKPIYPATARHLRALRSHTLRVSH